ncbi:hypothetical protein HHI36_001506 [Cryptolaemus montrouzieri]|uniref:Uncharacterized protein n=1 Tax=Cryptolaemus montrouzieri TaxID=559131 RepID=A0ABD2P848_9CUCU
MTIISVDQYAIFLLNLLKTFTKRSFFSRLLMRLPEPLFPSSRIMVNNIIIRKRSDKECDTIFVSDTESSGSVYCRGELYCHEWCSETCLLNKLESSEEDTQDELEIPLPPPLPPSFRKTDRLPEGNMLENLKNVKLRPVGSSARSLPERSISEDLLYILKKRYSAMHSPSPRRTHQKTLLENTSYDATNLSF